MIALNYLYIYFFENGLVVSVQSLDSWGRSGAMARTHCSTYIEETIQSGLLVFFVHCQGASEDLLYDPIVPIALSGNVVDYCLKSMLDQVRSDQKPLFLGIREFA